MSMQTQIKMSELSWLISDFFVDQFFQSYNSSFGLEIVVINRLPKRWLNTSHCYTRGFFTPICEEMLKTTSSVLKE